MEDSCRKSSEKALWDRQQHESAHARLQTDTHRAAERIRDR